MQTKNNLTTNRIKVLKETMRVKIAKKPTEESTVQRANTKTQATSNKIKTKAVKKTDRLLSMSL